MDTGKHEYFSWIRPSDLVRHGWTQHALARTAEGEEVEFDARDAELYCATGALRRAAANPREYLRWVQRVAQEVCKQIDDEYIPDACQAIEAWNDAPKRQQDEVVQLLRGCDL